MRPSDSPGPRRPFVGSGWTWTDRSVPDPYCTLAAPRKTRLGRTGRHPLARPAALGSCRRRLYCALAPAYPESLLASKCERERQTSERLQAAAPWQPGADSSEPALLRAEVSRPLPARCLPYLPRLGVGLRNVSRASVPQGSISTPTHAVSAPETPTISLSFAPFGQYPVAHGPSVPRWLAGGSRAVSTPACKAGHSLVQPPPRASASNVQASEPRASGCRPSPSAGHGTRVPSPGCPASPATGRLHYQPGPRPGRAPSTAPPGPPEADRDPGPRLRHRGLRAPAHKSVCHLQHEPFLSFQFGTKSPLSAKVSTRTRSTGWMPETQTARTREHFYSHSVDTEVIFEDGQGLRHPCPLSL
jgi:hypothetical protein